MDRFPKRAIILAIALVTVPAGPLGMQAWASSWSVEAPQGSDWAEASEFGVNQNTVLLVKCTSDMAGIGLTLRDFWGTALGRTDGERYPVQIVVRDGDGGRTKYDIGLRYDAGGKEWNTDGYDLPRSFLDVFATGVSMRFDSLRARDEIASYRLDGSADTARRMRQACWEQSDD